MKASDARAMTVDQLDDEVLKLKKEQFNLRFQRATGQLENTSRVRVVRRDIARILTIARQKRSGDEPKLAVAPAKLKQAKTEGSQPARAKPKATAKRRAPVKSRSNRGERTATRAPSRREKERRSGFPATSASRTETEAASAGASDRRARSRSWNSHPRLQKYERAWSSAKTGSETTRVYPSSSIAYALPPWIPRSVVKPAEETRSRYRFGSQAISAKPVSAALPSAGRSFIRMTWESGSGLAAAERRYRSRMRSAMRLSESRRQPIDATTRNERSARAQARAEWLRFSAGEGRNSGPDPIFSA